MRDGDDWIANGKKHYISNGGVAKLYIVAMRTDPTKGVSEGMTYFLLDPSMDGFDYGKFHDKLGQRLSLNAELLFNECRIPDAHRITEVNKAMEARKTFVLGSNIEAAATVLGTARASHEEALEYARNRVQGGKPIIEHQAVGFMLCDSFAEYEASSFRIATRSMEVWGGMGYMTEAPMEKYLRDVTSFLHSDGTNQTMRILSMKYL